jgi:translation initiation factor eIF-2B subunit beta
MDFINRIENLPFITNFKRKLRKKDYVNSTYAAKETAELFYQIIENSINEKSITNLAELVLVVTYLGKMFTTIDPIQFCTGNTVKRIMHIIREEIKDSIKEDKADYDKTQEIIAEKIKGAKNNIQKIRNFDFEEIKEKKHPENKDKENDDENEEESTSEKTSTQKLYEVSKQKLNVPITETIKNNILQRVEELISEIDNISESIIEQKEIKDLISDGDIILTSNYSQQVADILIENAKTKKFKVIVAESTPLITKKSQAEILIKKGIDTTIIDENDLYDVMKMAKIKVLLGARAILVNGGLITYGGAYNICLAANMFYVPVIVAGGTTKITPLHSFKHELYNEYLSPDLIFGKNVKYEGDISNIQFNNPAFDYIPPNLITMYATNIGIINPKYLYRLFADMYDQEDYAI